MEERSPAALLLKWIFWLIALLLLLIILVTLISAAGMYFYAFTSKDANALIAVLGPFIGQFDSMVDSFFNKVFPEIWQFISPLAQVAILLVVLEWFFRKMGISFNSPEQVAGVVPQFSFVAGIAVLSLLSVVNRDLLDNIWESIDQVVVLILILSVIIYFLNKIGIDRTILANAGNMNVQAIMALVIIGALALLSLVNVEGANVVKDLALVVVRFYFGSRRGISGEDIGKHG